MDKFGYKNSRLVKKMKNLKKFLLISNNKMTKILFARENLINALFLNNCWFIYFLI